MGSTERVPPAPRPAVDPVAWEAGRSVAALFDVLDRADGGSLDRRPVARRPAAHRPAGARSGGVRTVPLRSVQPAPSARPAPAAPAVAEAAPAPSPAANRAGSFLRRLVRRAALWGAGPNGEHLAWGGPARIAAKPASDRPVVLRELPSTPTIQHPTTRPAVTSPAAVQPPHGPASA